jgi:hypothetical protein
MAPVSPASTDALGRRQKHADVRGRRIDTAQQTETEMSLTLAEDPCSLREWRNAGREA